MYNIIDIHSHLLPNVDDGSKDLSMSLDVLKKQESVGVKKIVLTPHYKGDVYNITASELQKIFLDFKTKVKEAGLNVQLYLGQEIYCDSSIYDNLKSGVVSTLNGTKYLLLEFNYFEETDIADYVHNLTTMGYIPIIAHVERYTYLDWNTIFDLKQMGALIQVNASSIIGENGRRVQKYLLKAMSKGLIDFVSSDIHMMRQTSLDKAYKKISKTLGEEVAKRVLYDNALKITD